MATSSVNQAQGNNPAGNITASNPFKKSPLGATAATIAIIAGAALITLGVLANLSVVGIPGGIPMMAAGGALIAIGLAGGGKLTFSRSQPQTSSTTADVVANDDQVDGSSDIDADKAAKKAQLESKAAELEAQLPRVELLAKRKNAVLSAAQKKDQLESKAAELEAQLPRVELLAKRKNAVLSAAAKLKEDRETAQLAQASINAALKDGKFDLSEQS